MNIRNQNGMTRRGFARTAAMGAAGLAASAMGAGHARAATDRPNILLLMTDQHRADCLGCAGNSAIKTPNLDSIARGGVRFTSAYTCVPSCTPARSALLSGLSPWHNGMLGYGRVSNNYPVKLPRAVRDAGYYTFGIGKMHWFPQKTTQGFHGTLVDESSRVETPGFVSDYRKWFAGQAPDLDPDATGIGFNDYRAGVYALPEELHPTHWTAQTAVDFIEKYDRPEPFLLKVSFARPHSPYDPPERFMEMYAEDDMPAPSVGDWAAPFAPHDDPPNPSLWYGDLGVAQAKRSRRGYYGSVSFIDEQIGRVLDALRRRGMSDNTLILFTADHGDMLGDHHHWRKTYAYEGSAAIPMLLRWPASFGMDDRRGTELPHPVELRDVLPTFLDAAGAPIPGHLDGASLLGPVRDRTIPWREYIDFEHDVCYEQSNHWNALSDGRWKFIFHAWDGREQLFDLYNDPGEERDLSSSRLHNGIRDDWRQLMARHFAERGEPFVKNGRLLVRKERMLYSPLFPGHD